jgi:metallo-beta-lactamase class B
VTLAGCIGEFGVPPSMRPWDRDFPAFTVIGNIHFVGSSDLAQFLVTTPEGHILLDTGFEDSVPRLREHVVALGFRFEDIKFVLNSHAHIDHAQGDAVVRQLTHASVVSSRPDAPFIAGGGTGETVYDGVYSWRPCPVDRIVDDGDTVSLGGTTLTAHLTPGHTKGATTWTMTVKDGTRTRDVVFFPSANINRGVRLLGNARYPAIASDFERSFAIWKGLPCAVFLGAHGDFFDLKEKYERLHDGSGVNPFIDPGGYRRVIADAEKRFRDELASER